MQQERTDPRQDWRDRRRMGDRVAVFHAGEVIRCPATRRHRGLDAICGQGQDMVADGTRVTVVADRRTTDRQTGALNRVCGCCKAKLRVEVEPAASGERAA